MTELVRRNTDGRVARGERTREAILDAHTSLVTEGVLKPTGKVVAERAGISLRTLWLNYKDLESLLEASVERWLGTDAALRLPVDPSLPLEDRIETYCRQRVARLEHIAPAARSAALGEPFSPALQASRREHVQRSLDDLQATFASEIAAAGPDRDVLLHALFVATSWPTWSTLRDDLGLDVDAATAVMRSSVARLVAH
jgi:TetR/AcrR family transcriptional regulator of autoinduction and epiphytic fitness